MKTKVIKHMLLLLIIIMGFGITEAAAFSLDNKLEFTKVTR